MTQSLVSSFSSKTSISTTFLKNSTHDERMEELRIILDTLLNHDAFRVDDYVNVTFKSNGIGESYISLVFIKDLGNYEIKFFQHLSRQEMSGKTHRPFIHYSVLCTQDYNVLKSFFSTPFINRVCTVETGESDFVPASKREVKFLTLLLKWLKEFGSKHDHHGSFHPDSIEPIFQHVLLWIDANYGS